METICMLIFFLSFLAFVVGMFNPQNVKLKSRGKVALVYLGVCLVAVVIASSFDESETGNSVSQRERTSVSMEDAGQKQETSPSESVVIDDSKFSVEPPILTSGSSFEIEGATRGERVKFTFKEIKALRLSDGTYNLVMRILIKNNTSEQTLAISDIEWKLTDADMIEIEEAGIMDYSYGDLMPDSFWFTVVKPGFGKNTEVGYKVPKGTYYLCLVGEIFGKIVI